MRKQRSTFVCIANLLVQNFLTHTVRRDKKSFDMTDRFFLWKTTHITEEWLTLAAWLWWSPDSGIASTGTPKWAASNTALRPQWDTKRRVLEWANRLAWGNHRISLTFELSLSQPQHNEPVILIFLNKKIHSAAVIWKLRGFSLSQYWNMGTNRTVNFSNYHLKKTIYKRAIFVKLCRNFKCV